MPHKDEAVRKAYMQEHYRNNKDVYNRTSKASLQKRQAVVNELKESSPCADCGVYYPHYVMDYDHLGDKVGNVSLLVKTASLQRVLDEIAKCDLVCSNCHRARTFLRASGEDAS